MQEISNANQLVLKDVYILSRPHAISFRCSRPWACISIATEPTDFAEIDEANRVDLLQSAFADLEQAPSEVTLKVYPELKDALFTKLHAHQILDFVDRIAGRVSVLMVHCALGQSRSPAVTASLLGIDPKLLRGASANLLVHTLLEDCKRQRRDAIGVCSGTEGRIFGSELAESGSPVRSDCGTEWTIFPADFEGR